MRLHTVLSARLDLSLAVVQILLLHRSAKKKLTRVDAGTAYAHINNHTPKHPKSPESAGSLAVTFEERPPI
ncbi:MAG: hypothetical protein ABSC56_05745 [Solirubrobacteraceae bacterium]